MYLANSIERSHFPTASHYIHLLVLAFAGYGALFLCPFFVFLRIKKRSDEPWGRIWTILSLLNTALVVIPVLIGFIAVLERAVPQVLKNAAYGLFLLACFSIYVISVYLWAVPRGRGIVGRR